LFFNFFATKIQFSEVGVYAISAGFSFLAMVLISALP